MHHQSGICLSTQFNKSGSVITISRFGWQWFIIGNTRSDYDSSIGIGSIANNNFDQELEIPIILLAHNASNC